MMVLAVGLAASTTAHAGAAHPIPATPYHHAVIHASPNPARRGQNILVYGSVPKFGIAPGCPVGDEVTLISKAFPRAHEFASIPAIYALVRHNGSFSVRTRVPGRIRAGRYLISARCGGGDFGTSTILRVLN